MGWFEVVQIEALKAIGNNIIQ